MPLLIRASVALLLPVLLGAGAPTEYQVKAVFLYNFVQFVEWPAVAFAEPEAPYAICVLGEDPFGAALEDVVAGEVVGGRPLMLRRYGALAGNEEQIGRCHVLYVSRSAMPDLDAILTALRGRSVLTVGDGEGFATRGGMVRFLTESNRIRLRINVDAATGAGLTISSKLLRLAEIVPRGVN